MRMEQREGLRKNEKPAVSGGRRSTGFAVWIITLAILFAAVVFPVQANRNTAGAAEKPEAPDSPVTDRNGAAAWDCVWFGRYPQSSDGQGGFSSEPIKWRVLQKDGDDLFLLADRNLDVCPYNREYVEVTWENCTLRIWLNSNFLTGAFNPAEREAILSADVVNGENERYRTPGGKNTKDKVYLLSLAEAKEPRYGFSAESGKTETRQSLNTEYTESRINSIKNEDNADWWKLRSPGYEEYTAASISGYGRLDECGNIVNSKFGTIRPAVHIKCSSGLWTYAGTVSSSGTVNEKKMITEKDAVKTKAGAAWISKQSSDRESAAKKLNCKDVVDYFLFDKRD